MTIKILFITFLFAKVSFAAFPDDGWARYQSLYMKVLLSDYVRDGLVDIAQKYEAEGDFQNAIWTYREALLFNQANRLEKCLISALESFAPRQLGRPMLTFPTYVLMNNEIISTKRAGLVDAGFGVIAVLRPLRAQVFSQKYNSEVIAYLIDKKLNLDIVPVSVERVWNDKVYSAQAYVHNKKHNLYYEAENDFGQNSYPPGSWKMFVLDYLMGMHDRSPANWLLRAGSHFVAIDNDAVFYKSLKDSQRLMVNRDTLMNIPEDFIQTLKTIDFDFLTTYLSPETLRSVIQRRDEMVRVYESFHKPCVSSLLPKKVLIKSPSS